MQETLFQVAKHQGLFLMDKKHRQVCTTQKSGLGMQQPIGYHNPNILISKYPVWRCRLGSLTGSWQSFDIPSARIYGWRTALAPPSTIPYFWVWTQVADSGIVMVDGCFMVEGPCVNHAEKAVNHVLWLTGFLGRWLTEPCLMSNFELSGHHFGTILKSFILAFQCASI